MLGDLSWLVHSSVCSGKVAKDVHGIWVQAWDTLRAKARTGTGTGAEWVDGHGAPGGNRNVEPLPAMPTSLRESLSAASGENSDSESKPVETLWLQCSAMQVVEAIGGAQLSDRAVIDDLVLRTLDSLGAKGIDTGRKYIESGNDRTLGFFVGAVLKESKGAANPEVAK